MEDDWLSPVSSASVTEHEVYRYRTARFKVTNILPASETPMKNVYIFDHQELEVFLEGYEKYEEFLIGVEWIGTSAEETGNA